MGTAFLGLVLTRVLNMYISFALAICLLGIDPREIIWKVKKYMNKKVHAIVIYNGYFKRKLTCKQNKHPKIGD